MTNFVASLFLPKTLKFVVEEPVEESGDAPQSSRNGDGRRSEGVATSITPLTPTKWLHNRHSNARVTEVATGGVGGPDAENQSPATLMNTPFGQSPPVENKTPDVFAPRSPVTATSSEDDDANGIGSLSERLSRAMQSESAALLPHLRRSLNVPQSRAASPPAAELVHTRPHLARLASKTRPAELTASNTADEEEMRKILERRRRSNRVRSYTVDTRFSDAPYEVLDQHKGNGGLQNAVNAAVRDGKMRQATWIGTCGIPLDSLDRSTYDRIERDFRQNHNSHIVRVKDTDFDQHYNHFCGRILWPLMHYQVPDSPRAKIYEEHSWQHYVKVNEAFADTIAQHYKRGDTVWINDYHLLLVPGMLRRRIPHAMIGFFLHIAFPSSEVFRCLAFRVEILHGMLGANVIGFQTKDYVHHFKQTCSRLLYVETLERGIQLEHSFVDTVTLPIGIDPRKLGECFSSPEVPPFAKAFKEKYPHVKLIVGRDKFDRVKGVRQKLLAFERFLKHNPEWHEKVVLVQFGSMFKGDLEVQQNISDIVTRINSRYSNISRGYIPVVLQQTDISYNEYLALLSIADCFMVTSLREGMNLTCHEYIFCQQQRKNTLILSEFAGSATVLSKGSIMINPWDYNETAGALKSALEMSEGDKEQRWQGLMRVIESEDGSSWASQFVKLIQSDFIEQQKRRSVDLPEFHAESFSAAFRRASRRLIFVDYEGTLVNWAPRQQLIAGTGAVIELLNSLTADERNTVYVTSERTPSDLERTFRRVTRLGLIAENGGYVRTTAGDWLNLTKPSDLQWKRAVRDILRYYRERVPGSMVEEQNNRMIFHYASCEDQAMAMRQVSEMFNHIMDSSAKGKGHAIPMDGALVVEPAGINKATAAKHVTTLEPQADFLIVFGNDRSDEEIFLWANEQHGHTSLTVSVGVRNTEARAFVRTSFGVLSALHTLNSGTPAKPLERVAMSRQSSQTGFK